MSRLFRSSSAVASGAYPAGDYRISKFRVLQNTSQSKCKPMRERPIASSGRFDLDRRPSGPTPGGQAAIRLSVDYWF
jgi:hypothetical protein